MALDQAKEVIDSLGTAGSKAGPAYWAILVMALAMGGVLYLMYRMVDYGHVRSARAIDQLVLSIERETARTDKLLNEFVENAPAKIDERDRMEFKEILEDNARRITEIRDELESTRNTLRMIIDHDAPEKPGR